jgi:hypothetical protein
LSSTRASSMVSRHHHEAEHRAPHSSRSADRARTTT